MDDNRLEFHKEIKSLPSEISVVYHVADRINELKRLYNDIATKKSEKLIHQMLPNYMRRRAMSHNPKRLPLKYRKMHINQMAKSGPNAKKKRPSRKYRRRPRNLMDEYERRKKRSGAWMETHIWHAKRYHMKELWGYKIPYAPTDKRYRASYRAAANHCLLQDISYIAPIEISGPLECLKSKFDLVTSTDAGLSFTAKCYMNGTRAGKIDLFKVNRYPYEAIAKVDFIWRPKDSENDIKTLWIFVHPSVYQEVLEEFITLFELKNVNQKHEIVSDVKLITRNDVSVRNPKYVNEHSKISLLELKNTINHFRLTGPFSNAILMKAFKPSENYECNWISELFENRSEFKNSHELQIDFWEKEFKSTKSPSEIPPNSIFNINVIDPRTNRPAKREIAMNIDSDQNNNEIIEMESSLSISSIWMKEFRDKITNEMMSTGELCKLRNKQQLVPGIASEFEKKLQPVPLLFIQRPGLLQDRFSFGSGFDLIIPSGYGMSVWLSLIRCGAKSGGWREVETIASEMSEEIFLPDTLASRKENLRKLKISRENYFKKPQNKRVNYRKMGILSPFICPWQQLIIEWNGNEENFSIVRKRETLEKLQNILKGKLRMDEREIPNNFLIPINITMDSKGSPIENGIVCLPSKRDIKTFLQKKFQKDHSPLHFEPVKIDEDENIRKNLRICHKKLLKRLRNRRIRVKRRVQATSDVYVKIPKSTTEKLVKEQFQKMSELWLPSQPKTLRHQCSRQVIGYATTSRFVFTEGKVCSLGYLTKNGFLELLAMFNKFKGLQPFVLTRSSSSKSYHASKLIIRQNL